MSTIEADIAYSLQAEIEAAKKNLEQLYEHWEESSELN